jgi:hypothetical protein
MLLHRTVLNHASIAGTRLRSLHRAAGPSHVHDDSALGSLQVNKALLGVQAAAESGQRAVAADASMAWHNYRERVLSDGSAYGPGGSWAADGFSDGLIANQLPIGDGEQYLPYIELKRGPHRRQRKIETFELSLEIGPQLGFDRCEELRALLPIVPYGERALLLRKNDVPQPSLVSHKGQGSDQARIKIVVVHCALPFNCARGKWPRKRAMDATLQLFAGLVSW